MELLLLLLLLQRGAVYVSRPLGGSQPLRTRMQRLRCAGGEAGSGQNGRLQRDRQSNGQ